MNIQAVINDFNERKDRFIKTKTKYETLLDTRKNLLNLRDKKLTSVEVLEQARMLIAESSMYAKEQVKVQLENLVTSALQYVFEDNRRFEIEIIPGKTRTEAEFYHITYVNGEEKREVPEEDNGGGVVDIISIVLRFAMFEAFTDPVLGGPLVLDEPVKMVSAEYISKIGEFLLQIKSYFGRQIIMSSHNMYLMEIGDTKHLVTMTDDGISHVDAVA